MNTPRASSHRVASRYLLKRSNARTSSKVTVYRVGTHPENTLENKNAANLEGILAFLNQECEDYVLDFCMKGGVITEYLVHSTSGEPWTWGDYQKYRGGIQQTSLSPDLLPGRIIKGDVEWYSFPEEFLRHEVGGRQVRPGRRLPVERLSALAQDKYGEDFMALSGEMQLSLLRGFFH